jgi:hypothetical protein
VRLAEKIGRTGIEIVPDDDFVCDRSLAQDAFEARTGYRSPGWNEMLDELAGEIREREGLAESAGRR